MFPQFGSKRLVETAQRIGHFDFKSRAGLKSQFGEGPMTEAVDRLNRRAIEAEQRLPEFADAVLVISPLFLLSRSFADAPVITDSSVARIRARSSLVAFSVNVTTRILSMVASVLSKISTTRFSMV